MSTVGVRELKNKLSSYLRQVKQGERVTITERGKVVAVITPPLEYTPSAEIVSMVQEEKATWSGGKPSGSAAPVKGKGKPISQTVIDERR